MLTHKHNETDELDMKPEELSAVKASQLYNKAMTDGGGMHVIIIC